MSLIKILVLGVVLMGICASGTQASNVEYLSDSLELILYSSQGWGELGINTAAYPQGSTAMKLRIKDKEYSNGLGTHAPGEIVIDLDGCYEKFEAEVGVQWQGGSVGSVEFIVFLDEKKMFDSGVMTEHDPSKPVSINVAGASVLRLVVTDGGDGFTCDCADWAEARLVPSESPTPRKAFEGVNIAPFAQIITCDPDRTDGARASRTEEFLADDIFLETEVPQAKNGTYIVPTVKNGLGCIGLKWTERRLLKEVGLQFADGSNLTSTEGMQVQGWFGMTAHQGEWKPLNGTIEPQGNSLLFRIDWRKNREAKTGLQKIRWIFPPSTHPIVVQDFTAFTLSQWKIADLTLQLEKTMPGKHGEIEICNGNIITPSDSPLRCDWDLGRPLQLKVRYNTSESCKYERTVIRLRLPEIAFGVAVDDVLANGCVYVPEAGFFATSKSSKLNLAEYKKKIAKRKTILELVREMPDQTFEQALVKTRNPIQDNGPTLLSLACDNHKFVAYQDGRIQFGDSPDATEGLVLRLSNYKYLLQPQFGSGKHEQPKRHLEGGWLPVPVITAVEGGVTYRERAFAAPYDDKNAPEYPWLNGKTICVVEFTMDNPEKTAADVSLTLTFLSDISKGEPAEVKPSPNGAVVQVQGSLVASVDTGEAKNMLQAEIQNGVLRLTGKLSAGGHARCCVYIPAWKIKSDERIQFKDAEALLQDVKAHWERMLAPALQFEIPDALLSNVIRASQVRCLIAGRNEEAGARIAPWIAAFSYGPLESESNSVIRGMEFMGHDEFARRSVDYFIKRYNSAGFLTTGYTVMGTGWHLWMLGEHYRLTHDSDWLKQVAPEAARVCQWIVQQREKTKKLDANGEKVPEYGLMPPGVMADWGNFVYYFCLNGYYYAGLHSTASALADIGYPGADDLLKNAEDFRREILRAYEWTRSRVPVFGLKDGTWVREYPSQVYNTGPTEYIYPGADGNRSWCYDVELGTHQLVPQGLLDANSRSVSEMMDHMEDVQFLHSGTGDYPAEKNEKDWFNLGGFSKVQPYYCRNAEIYAMRDEVKPFVRSYFNALSSLLNTENLFLWEHFHNIAAWDKTHETGYFLHQTRSMLVTERGDQLWLAPLITNNWLKDGMTVAVRNAPTLFGKVSYRIESHVKNGFIEAVIEPPIREQPKELVIRLRHPEGKQIRSVTVNGAKYDRFDSEKECVYLKPASGTITVRANY